MPVIVDCESCHTRFRLDEARIPASGAKVRCSKCKTAFVVKRPQATLDEHVAEVVAEATNPGNSVAPPPTEDLFETNLPPNETLDGRPSDAGDEKWEFDEPPRSQTSAGSAKPATAPAPALAPPAAPRAAAPRPAAPKAAAPVASAASPAEADDLDALGSPDEWDFLAGTRKPAAVESAHEPVAEAPAPELAAPRVLGAVDRAVATAAAEAPRFTARSASASSAWSERARDVAQTAIDSSMWIAALGLCVAGLVLALMPPSGTPTTDTPPGHAGSVLQGTFAGHPIDVTLRRVESAVGGTLTIVRGQLPASGPATGPTRVRARWTDARGHPLAGDTALVGPALTASELREHSLARVRALHEERSGAVARGGAFEAAFGALPEGARGIALDAESAPIPASEATSETLEARSEATTGTEAAATASSLPTARPSSE